MLSVTSGRFPKMPLNEFIEIAVPAETTTTDRGRLLESLARRLLKSQNFAVETEVRLTGTEVDLLATEQTTGERVFVECKGYRSTISAEVLYKILGNVAARDLSAGWLVSTYALGKDAKGVRDEWTQKPPEKRRQLQIYDPAALIKRLVAAQLIVSPDVLNRPAAHRYSDDAYLLVTPYGDFWALPVLDAASGIRQSVLLFEAHTGAQVSEEQTIDRVAQTDTTLASLTWLRSVATAPEADSARLRNELQSIVRVPTADHWADYRPARPQDFVGRDQLQADVFDLFERIVNQKTRTRLVALKAPSGWGKSSSILKIEPPRLSWRLQQMRRWSHDEREDESIFA